MRNLDDVPSGLFGVMGLGISDVERQSFKFRVFT